MELLGLVWDDNKGAIQILNSRKLKTSSQGGHTAFTHGRLRFDLIMGTGSHEGDDEGSAMGNETRGHGVVFSADTEELAGYGFVALSPERPTPFSSRTPPVALPSPPGCLWHPRRSLLACAVRSVLQTPTSAVPRSARYLHLSAKVREQRSRLRFGGACRRDRNAVRLAWSVDQLISVASFEGVASAARCLSIGEQKRGGWEIVGARV